MQVEERLEPYHAALAEYHRLGAGTNTRGPETPPLPPVLTGHASSLLPSAFLQQHTFVVGRAACTCPLEGCCFVPRSREPAKTGTDEARLRGETFHPPQTGLNAVETAGLIKRVARHQLSTDSLFVWRERPGEISCPVPPCPLAAHAPRVVSPNMVLLFL